LPEDVAFIAKPYLPGTIVDLIRRMATPQIVEPAATRSSDGS
jgi:hypothetical protein